VAATDRARWLADGQPRDLKGKIPGMSESALRAGGVVVTIAYAVFIGWLAASQPQSMAEVTGGLAATFGAYEVDAVSFDEGLRLFRQDQFEAARSAWSRADPAGREARTQFYVAYSYYRQGWGRVSHDDGLYAAGLDALSRAVAAAPGGQVVVSDPDLQIQTADELAAELRAGLTRDWADLNPLRVLGSRK
jgi:hypothetical protein